jgi:hypothetical protein
MQENFLSGAAHCVIYILQISSKAKDFLTFIAGYYYSFTD